LAEIDAFKSKVEQFIADREMTPTQFGKIFAGDPLFVFQLRDKREPRSQTRQKIVDAMNAYPVREESAA
jgi:homoserine dehydrogenase